MVELDECDFVGAWGANVGGDVDCCVGMPHGFYSSQVT